jgi:hypothetical protein
MDKELNEAWRNLGADRENEFLVQKYLNLLSRKKDNWSQKPPFMFIGEGNFFIREAKGENKEDLEEILIDGTIVLLCDSICRNNSRLDILVEDKKYGPILSFCDHDSEREWVNLHYRETNSVNKLSDLNFVLFAYEWESHFGSDEGESDFLSSLSSDSNNLPYDNNAGFHFLSSKNKSFELSFASFSSPFQEEEVGFKLVDIKEGYSILKDMTDDDIDRVWDLL